VGTIGRERAAGCQRSRLDADSKRLIAAAAFEASLSFPRGAWERTWRRSASRPHLRLDGTPNVRTWVPTQSVGTRKTETGPNGKVWFSKGESTPAGRPDGLRFAGPRKSALKFPQRTTEQPRVRWRLPRTRQTGKALVELIRRHHRAAIRRGPSRLTTAPTRIIRKPRPRRWGVGAYWRAGFVGILDGGKTTPIGGEECRD
jgi:hypothetical protein